MKKIRLISLFISIGRYNRFVKDITSLATNHTSSYVCVSNVHMLIEAYRSKVFADVVNGANIATPDGMPLAKATKLLYKVDQDRVAGMDLMPDLMRLSEKQGLSIFLYGSTEEILKKIVAKAKVEFPGLVLNFLSPPFRKLTDKEEESIVQNINDTNPNFVFVALGCPKQEMWMAEHKGKINSCMIGLGGAFEVYAEVKSRAPKWMQNNSLEWLYRLIQDPKRLWKRYLFTNTLFIMLFLKQIIRMRIFKKYD